MSTTTTAAKTLTIMKTLKFGTELEVIGISSRRAAEVVAGVLGTAANLYFTSASMTDGRVWSVVHDGSVHDTTGRGACEVVTPILGWDDLDVLQEVTRALRAAGARVNASCGQHVHVGAGHLSVNQIRTLVSRVYRNEDVIVDALGVTERVANGSFCRATKKGVVDAIHTADTTSMSDVEAKWYRNAGGRSRGSKYDNSRYHGLNVHSLFYRGTVEFRWFAGTLHAGEVKAHVILCLSLVANALMTKTYRFGKSAEVVKFTGSMAELLDYLGLSGADFANVRTNLTKRARNNVANVAQRAAV
jgi:hypothetical protein